MPPFNLECNDTDIEIIINVNCNGKKYTTKFDNRLWKKKVDNSTTLTCFQMGLYYQSYIDKHNSDFLTQLILENKKDEVSLFNQLGDFYVKYLIDKGYIQIERPCAVVSPAPRKDERDKLSGWKNLTMKKYEINLDLTKYINRINNDYSKNVPLSKPIYQLNKNVPFLPNLKAVLFLDDMISSGRTMKEIYLLVKKIAPNAKFYPISLTHPS